MRLPIRFLAQFGLIAGLIAPLTASSNAQAPGINTGAIGDKAVVSGSSSISPSAAYIDASAFQPLASNADDICAVINMALQALPSTGGVVDARGVLNTTKAGNDLTCAAGTTPWLQTNGSTWTFTTTPADILLPTTSTICIYTPWIIPNQTRVFGDRVYGSDGTVLFPANGTQNGCNGTFSDNETSSSVGSIIYMGWVGQPTKSGHYPSSPLPCPSAGCTGVAISDLEINGVALPTASSWTAITNPNSSANSYVDQIEFPGLTYCGVCSTAPSGADYSNLTSVMTDGSTFNAALDLNATTGPSAVFRGASFLASATTTNGIGIYIPGQLSDIQDTHFEDFGQADVEITSSTSAQGAAATVINVTGGTPQEPEGGTIITSAVQLNSTASSGFGVDVDVALLGTSSSANCQYCTPSNAPNTINDETSGMQPLSYSFNNSNDTDQAVGMYVVGELVGDFTQASCDGASNAGLCPETRFQTSPRYPTWGVGNGAPSGNACTTGSIYTNSKPGGPEQTLFVCSIVSGSPAWENIE